MLVSCIWQNPAEESAAMREALEMAEQLNWLAGIIFSFLVVWILLLLLVWIHQRTKTSKKLWMGRSEGLSKERMEEMPEGRSEGGAKGRPEGRLKGIWREAALETPMGTSLGTETIMLSERKGGAEKDE